jgi:hypothetical protein
MLSPCLQFRDWATRFSEVLGARVEELTGDSELEGSALEAADIICTTPEKFGVQRMCMQVPNGCAACTCSTHKSYSSM